MHTLQLSAIRGWVRLHPLPVLVVACVAVIGTDFAIQAAEHRVGAGILRGFSAPVELAIAIVVGMMLGVRWGLVICFIAWLSFWAITAGFAPATSLTLPVWLLTTYLPTALYAKALQHEQRSVEVEASMKVAREREKFVAVASHELRTPLTSIGGFAQTLEDRWDTVPTHQREQFLRIIVEQSDRLTRLLNDLLTVSKLQSSHGEPAREAMLLLEVLEEAMQVVSGEFVIEVDPGCRVDANRDLMMQAITNLLANAVTHGAAPITVRAKCEDGWTQIDVADSGRGVNEQFRARLFNEFAQENVSGNSGTGLGLAIVKSIAEAHGGSVAFEPNVPRGSIFSVRIPQGTSL